jgi:chromosome segregation ATPase
VTKFANAPDARAELARLIQRRDDANERLTAAKAALARLENAMAAEGRIAAELQALDLREARALSLWAADIEGDAPPVLESDRRRELEARLAAAKATGAAARTAIAGPRAEAERAGAEIAAINSQAIGVAAIVALAELEPMIGEIEHDAAKLATRRQMLGTGREMALRHVERLPMDRRPREFFVALERLNERIERANSAQTTDAKSEGAYAHAIVALLASLPHDATATTL